jgi:nucleoside-diphosphate-sugar epimerase
MAAQLTGSPSVLFAVNVVGTRLLIRACVQHSVKRLLLVSSLSVYAAQSLPRGGLLDERCPLDPEPHLRDAYTFSKIEQERVAWAAQQAGTLPVVVLRPGVLFGPGRPLLGGRLGIRVGPLFVRMGGRRAVPYVYVDNCAEAVALAVDAPGVDGHALNIVDDNLPTANDLFSLSCRVSRVRSVMVPRWAVQPLARAYARYADRSGGQLPRVLTPYRAAAQWNTLQYPNAQAKHALGWRPSVSLAEALSRTTAAL